MLSLTLGYRGALLISSSGRNAGADLPAVARTTRGLAWESATWLALAILPLRAVSASRRVW